MVLRNPITPHEFNDFRSEHIGWHEQLHNESNLLSATPGNFLQGVASPEGVVTAPIGTLFVDTTGGAGITLWIKDTGAGNTGWASCDTTPG